MKAKNKEKILVAMSGGVDSSVVAALLVRAGYDVTGAFMITQIAQINGEDYLSPRDPAKRDTDCDRDAKESCWSADYRDAVRVAAKLGIPLLKLDFTKEYKKLVLDYMFREYEAGRTPNPDVLCNKFIKFGVWLTQTRKMGFHFLATGHYARLEILNPKSQILNKSKAPKSKLMCAVDTNKDQTYFLHQLSQEQLCHVLFPIGGFTKKEVRAMAKKWKLPTADKEESMGICFVGEVPMKEFLMTRIKPKTGEIIFSGKAVGKHDGLAFYTIGQRIAVKILNSKSQIPNKSQNLNLKPMYVIDKDLKNNVLIIGHEDDPLLYKKEIEVANVSWVSGQPPKFPLQCEVRLRHRQPLQKCVVDVGAIHELPLRVAFAEPQRAVTPGQFAVFYKHGECLGGGVIK